MDSAAAGLDFAVIGHQDSWQSIAAFVNSMRRPDQEKLSAAQIKTSYPFIPPRDVFRVKVKSADGTEINGVYIETFIDPDKLEAGFARANMQKVMRAAAWAKKMGARIVALGGFTSIVLEGNVDAVTTVAANFTTGNTLTAVYIAKALEKAAVQHGIDLQKANLLVIGATGDIGSACVHYFKNKTAGLLLCARNQQRLAQLYDALKKEEVEVRYAATPGELVPFADIIICAASSSGLQLINCRKKALVCDAGYPKNLEKAAGNGAMLFHGGMGQVSGGFAFDPDYSAGIYRYAAPSVIHGCILEAMVLAFEKRFENYSTGKGMITTEKMEEIYGLGQKHGIDIAPFYNAKGLWQPH